MLISPAEDFSKTLSAIAGTLGKLRYLAGLRQGNGEYFHWGMVRRHGEANANRAIAQVHTDLFLVTLRTPIQTLWEETMSVAEGHSANLKEYLEELLEQRESLLPAQLEGGAERHFNSVLLGLCSLAGLEEP